MTPEQILEQARKGVARARAERAADRTPRGRWDGPDPDSGSLSEDEERERSERPY